MADKTFNVRAILSAQDNGMSSALKKAQQNAENLGKTGTKLGSVFKSVLGANLVSAGITKGIGTLTSGIGGLMSELNSSTKAWKTFDGNLSQLGWGKKEIASAKKAMQDYATKTIYSASDMGTTFSQMAAIGRSDAGDLVKAMGGLAASAENPKQAMKTLSQQMVQAMTKPKVSWADFKLMMEQSPAGMAAVAKEMGMSLDELVTKIQNGEIKTDDFTEAFKRAGNSMQDLATRYKSVDEAVGGLYETVSNKLQPVFEKLSAKVIKGIEGIIDAFSKIDDSKIQNFANNLSKGIDKAVKEASQAVKAFWKGFSNTGAIKGLSNAFRYVASQIRLAFKSIDFNNLFKGLGSVLGDIGYGISRALTIATKSVSNFISSFADTGAFKAFKTALEDVWVVVKKLGSSLADVFNSSEMQTIISVLGTAFGTLAKWASQAASAIAKFVSSIPKSVLNGITSGILAIAAGFITAKAGISVLGAALKGLDFIKSLNPFKKFGKDAAEGTEQAANSVRRSKSTITQLFSGMANVIKSTGTSISTAAKGIGTGLSTAFKGFGQGLKAALQGLKGLNPATLLSFGAAVAIAAVGIGTGIAIIVASFTLLATQSQGVSQILKALGSAFSTVVQGIGKAAGTIIEAFGTAFGIVVKAVGEAAPGLARLSPLVEAIGTALGNAAPFISAFGDALTSILGVLPNVINAFTKFVTALGNAISGIVNAITPIVQIISDTITTVTQIIANAIVAIAPVIANGIAQVAQVIGQFGPQIAMVISAIAQAIQAAAPIIITLIQSIVTVVQTMAPVMSQVVAAIVTVVQTLAPIISQTISAIVTAITQIVPIITSIGGVISAALSGIASIVSAAGMAIATAAMGIGTAISTALSGVASIISATGTAI
ncbi:MAG: tape measure protein, partial [Streptococcus thermophilus]|nr:tape measure protein [Streptococcus thermophilus]